MNKHYSVDVNNVGETKAYVQGYRDGYRAATLDLSPRRDALESAYALLLDDGSGEEGVVSLNVREALEHQAAMVGVNDVDSWSVEQLESYLTQRGVL